METNKTEQKEQPKREIILCIQGLGKGTNGELMAKNVVQAIDEDREHFPDLTLGKNGNKIAIIIHSEDPHVLHGTEMRVKAFVRGFLLGAGGKDPRSGIPLYSFY